MEISCPHCRSRYRLDPATFPRRRVRLRCAGCGRAIPAAAPEPDVGATVWAERLARTLVQDLVRRRKSGSEAGEAAFREALARRRRAYQERVGTSVQLAALFDDVAAAVLAAARDD